LYSISSRALSMLRKYSTNQTILVNGDSGAGKTECIKILIDHVMAIASLPDQASGMRSVRHKLHFQLLLVKYFLVLDPRCQYYSGNFWKRENLEERQLFSIW
jgi:hypothetical protein